MLNCTFGQVIKMTPNETLDGVKGIECIGCCMPSQQFPLLDMTRMTVTQSCREAAGVQIRNNCMWTVSPLSFLTYQNLAIRQIANHRR